MFSIAKSLTEFINWANRMENLISIEPSLNFMVAYASLERYLFRIALALKVFQGEYSKDAHNDLKNDLQSLIGFCSNPKQGGNPVLRSTLTKIGLTKNKIEAFRIARNNLVHGANIGGKTINTESSKLLWEGLRQISELIFGDKNSHSKAPYRAWQRLPMRRRKKHK